MSRAARPAPYTLEDFCALVKVGEKADLIDGVIDMASPDHTDANNLFLRLGGLMDLFVEENNFGEVYGSRRRFSARRPASGLRAAATGEGCRPSRRSAPAARPA